ncbi:winged helix-turn-helix domain-containing protein [Colwelliaceae bacterium 6441]
MWHFDQWSFDTDTRIIKSDSSAIELTPKQAELLHYFISNHNQVLSRDTILNDVWQGRIVSDDTITNHVAKLRKFVKSLGSDEEYIKTISKKGYIWLIKANDNIPSESITDAREYPPSKTFIYKTPFLIFTVLFILITLLVSNLSSDSNHIAIKDEYNLPQKSIRLAVVPFHNKNITHQNGLLKTLALIFKANNSFTVLDFSHSQLNQWYFDDINTFKKIYELDYIIGPNLITNKVNSIVLQDSQSVIWQFDQLDKLVNIDDILRMQNDLISHFPAAQKEMKLIPEYLNDKQWQSLLASSSKAFGSHSVELSHALEQVLEVIKATGKSTFTTQLLFELIGRVYWFTEVNAEQVLSLLNELNPDNVFPNEQDQYNHLYLAMKYLLMQDNLKAKEHLEVAYQTMPNNNEVNRMLGQVTLNLGYPMIANQYFTKVYENNPIDQLNFIGLLSSLNEQNKNEAIKTLLSNHKQYHGYGSVIEMYQAKLSLESTGRIPESMKEDLASVAYHHPFALTIEILVRYTNNIQNLEEFVRYAKENLVFNQHTAFLFAEYLFMGGYQSEFLNFYDFYNKQYGDSKYHKINQEILASYKAVLTNNYEELSQFSEQVIAAPDLYLPHNNVPIILLTAINFSPAPSSQKIRKQALDQFLELLAKRGYKNWQMSLAKAGLYLLNNNAVPANSIISEVKNSHWIWRDAWFTALDNLKLENRKLEIN